MQNTRVSYNSRRKEKKKNTLSTCPKLYSHICSINYSNYYCATNMNKSLSIKRFGEKFTKLSFSRNIYVCAYTHINFSRLEKIIFRESWKKAISHTKRK